LLVTVTCRPVLAAGLDGFQVVGLPDQARSDGIEKLVALISLLARAQVTHLSSTALALALPVV